MRMSQTEQAPIFAIIYHFRFRCCFNPRNKLSNIRINRRYSSLSKLAPRSNASQVSITFIRFAKEWTSSITLKLIQILIHSIGTIKDTTAWILCCYLVLSHIPFWQLRLGSLLLSQTAIDPSSTVNSQHPRLSEKRMTNWSTKMKPVLTPHLYYKVMIKV